MTAAGSSPCRNQCFVSLDDRELLIADRLETETYQVLVTNPTNPHHTDVSLNGTSQVGRFDGTGANLSGWFGAQQGDIEHDADARNRYIRCRKFEFLPAEFQLHFSLQVETMVAAAFSHGGFSLIGQSLSHAPKHGAKQIPGYPTRLKSSMVPEGYTAGHLNPFHRHDN